MSKKEAEAQPSQAEVFAKFLDGLVENCTITADVAGIIKHAMIAKKL